MFRRYNALRAMIGEACMDCVWDDKLPSSIHTI
jgi:hypothetical protein